jgi:lipopolysaccharide/colanic/teichoic acid biosynthesis glycosyltransferase
MEPNILASGRKSAGASAETWTSLTGEVVRDPHRDAVAGRAVPLGGELRVPLNGNGAVLQNGANGHRNGHAALGVATTWPGLAPDSTATRLRGLALREVPEESGVYLRVGKRLFDIVGALVALVLSSPLLALAALLIKLESRGPVVYKSVRIGRGARPFTFFKLRSMVNGADRHRHTLSHLNETDGPVFKMARDPRVTRIGRLLRISSVDEIPQLWNVLRGEMSLVGPRPPIAEEVAQYEPWQLRRLDVLPGITCLWQISGRSRIGFQEWMRLDLEYIKHRSLWLDLKILVRTIPAVLSREGAY